MKKILKFLTQPLGKSKQNAAKKKRNKGVREVAQEIKVLAARLEDLSLILGTQAKVEREDKLHKVVSCPLHAHRNRCPHFNIK